MTDLVLLYDRDCGLCRTIVATVLAADRRHTMRPLALQTSEAKRLLPDLSDADRLASVHLIDRGGRVRSGGAALGELAELLPAGRWLARALRAKPRQTAWAYRVVADHRRQLGRLIPEPVQARATRRVQRAEAEHARLAGTRPASM